MKMAPAAGVSDAPPSAAEVVGDLGSTPEMLFQPTLGPFLSRSSSTRCGAHFPLQSPPVRYRLVHLSGSLAGRVREVSDREVVLGRDPAVAQVVFGPEDRLVSRRHAMLRV